MMGERLFAAGAAGEHVEPEAAPCPALGLQVAVEARAPVRSGRRSPP